MQILTVFFKYFYLFLATVFSTGQQQQQQQQLKFASFLVFILSLSVWRYWESTFRFFCISVRSSNISSSSSCNKVPHTHTHRHTYKPSTTDVTGALAERRLVITRQDSRNKHGDNIHNDNMQHDDDNDDADNRCPNTWKVLTLSVALALVFILTYATWDWPKSTFRSPNANCCRLWAAVSNGY